MRSILRAALATLAPVTLVATTTSNSLFAQQQGEYVAQLRKEAASLETLTRTPLGRQFLEACSDLPPGESRTVYRLPRTRRYFAKAELEDLDAETRGKLKAKNVDAEQFYTRYGTPLTYWRPLDLLGEAGLNSVQRRNVLDFGHGGIGHLRLLALMGAEATGVDVDSYFKALYSADHDQGPIERNGRPMGSVRLVHGRWPADERTRESVSGKFDVFIAKNVLKRGYIHPEKKVAARFLVKLGVDDETFCKALFDALKPGGFVLIYNISPAQNPPEKPYLPSADGRCPFSRELLQRVGFSVIHYNQDDSDVVRKQGLRLRWDNGSGNMDNVFAQYSLFERPI